MSDCGFLIADCWLLIWPTQQPCKSAISNQQ